ncbi:hypothetical protein OG422_09605 [Streptomyces sp. NBC_01525]|uniref:Uncharacterized protein n=1 Tax=Streptomyces benahoarensis TaxID=2595054 RepID=A0A553ZMF3_9ACTN|nr:hypothetical protein [Streptomyces benahoarensis]TSB24593.1 hypothetical protein FNJ62_13870 [Streptomyces benahoarensis]TSB42658.1 hypothetical protein FNZ23_08755 [Streptomyces benahoarensis]
MPRSILGKVVDLPDAAGPSRPHRLPDTASPHGAVPSLQCPACGSPRVAQMLGDNGGVSFVCTSCGHSWS